MLQVFLIFSLQIVSIVFMTACAHQSVFPIGTKEPADQVFQYCGGQQWGYSKKLGSESRDPYLIAYLTSSVGTKESLELYYVIQTFSKIQFTAKKKTFQIVYNGKTVFNNPVNFLIHRIEKRIDERYSNDYTYSLVEGTSNQWEVRKKKYGGFFGYMAREAPFIVTIHSPTTEEMKSDSISVDFEKENLGAVYILNTLTVPLKNNRAETGVISFKTPPFEINGTSYPEAAYTFHFDRQKLIDATKDVYRCASQEEIFRAERNKDSWIWWMYPRIKD